MTLLRLYKNADWGCLGNKNRCFILGDYKKTLIQFAIEMRRCLIDAFDISIVTTAVCF
jgi:hypothetical protein